MEEIESVTSDYYLYNGGICSIVVFTNIHNNLNKTQTNEINLIMFISVLHIMFIT